MVEEDYPKKERRHTYMPHTHTCHTHTHTHPHTHSIDLHTHEYQHQLYAKPEKHLTTTEPLIMLSSSPGIAFPSVSTWPIPPRIQSFVKIKFSVRGIHCPTNNL